MLPPPLPQLNYSEASQDVMGSHPPGSQYVLLEGHWGSVNQKDDGAVITDNWSLPVTSCLACSCFLNCILSLVFTLHVSSKTPASQLFDVLLQSLHLSKRFSKRVSPPASAETSGTNDLTMRVSGPGPSLPHQKA